MGRKNRKNMAGAFQQNWVSSGPGEDFYRVNDNVGSESRSVEFKSGPGFIHNNFRHSVAKYACGFVNSGENGTLMLGVEDSGTVRGYRADHNEMDNICKEIDNAMKDIQPNIFPKDYSVQFVPVWDEAGSHQIKNLWVIKIYVSGADIGVTDRLYETKQGVFMRRDGSVQGPLSAQMIQDWTKRQYQTKIEKHKKNEENLRHELSTKQRDYSNMDRRLKLKEEEIARREQAINDAVQNQNKQHTGGIETQLKQLQAENNELKISSVAIHQEIGEIKAMLSKQGQKQHSKVCAII